MLHPIILIALILTISCQKESEPDTTNNPEAIWQIGDKVRLDGELSEAELKELLAISVQKNGVAFYVGYQQVSSDNQNPVAYRFDNGKLSWRKTDYETSGDDGTAYGILWDGGDRLYFVFSATGTQGDASADYRRFCTNGWLTSYGNGGGAKVAILAKINPQTGQAESGTFVYAKTSDGKTNSLQATQLAFDTDFNVILTANSWYAPLKTDKTPFLCSGSSPFAYTLVLNPKLSSAIGVTADHCE